MKAILLALLLVVPLAHAQLPAPGEPGALNDPRYCGEPARTAEGRIKRNKAATRSFAQVFHCPATLEPVTSCAGWQIDHVLPLANGGCDLPFNMQWLPIAIKSGPGFLPKDRWEQKVYSVTPRPVFIPQ